MLKTNSYFDGNVASIALQTDTLPATVGVMNIGDYTFDTNQHEVMTVISGHLKVKLPNSNEWVNFRNGESFEVAAGASFDLQVPTQTAYLCTYEDK